LSTMPTLKTPSRFVLGITGGIATGKTTALQELKRVGIPTVSSDELAHACLRKGHSCYRRILKRFGRQILNSRQEIDRKQLGIRVFANHAQRKWLERQIHPHVIHQLKSFIRKHRGIIALDIPLLFEARLQKLVDKTIVIWSTEKNQLRRLKKRNGLPAADALKRIQAQFPLSIKKKRADYLIGNNSSQGNLRREVRALLKRLTLNKSHV
jgi:dephospho-CoA kinase